MPESKPSAMQQIIETIAQQWDGCEYDAPGGAIDIGNAIRRAGFPLAARAMQEQQAALAAAEGALAACRDAFPVPAPGHAAEDAWSQAIGDPLSVPAFVRAMLAASPSAPPVAGDESASAAPEGLAAHAIEELCQLGYTVRDGQLIPPDNLHELARVAGWASPSGGRATGDSVQQPVRMLTLSEVWDVWHASKAPGITRMADVVQRRFCEVNNLTIGAARIQQAAQPEAAQGCRAKKIGPDQWVCDCETPLACDNGRPAPNPEVQQAAKPVARWINVNERLPEPGAEVLTYHQYSDGSGWHISMTQYCPEDIGTVMDLGNKGWLYGSAENVTTTHWMPLPTAPSPAGAEAQQDAPADEWERAQAICDLPAVDEAIRNLLEDNTGDNATCLVREVMRAAAGGDQQPEGEKR